MSLHFIKEDEVENREEEIGVDPDPDEENIKNVVLGDERERTWFLRKTMEGWMGQSHFYMLISEMSTIKRRSRW